MKIFATVATYVDAPDKPELIAAWPARWLDGDVSACGLDENGAPESNLEMLRGDPATVAAAIIAVEVPDDELLPLLSPVIPTIRGAAAAVERPGASGSQQLPEKAHGREAHDGH